MLRKSLGGKVGLMHGQMKAAERDAAMAAFKAGETQLLVATTVIEVGVDVPEATIMVVEHAERFGLAQLAPVAGPGGTRHRQIVLPAGLSRHLGRNRQGAAARPCATPMTALSSPNRICACAGPAKCWDRRQSGMEDFRLADPVVHGELLAVAHDDARLILTRDPELKSARGESSEGPALSVWPRRSRALSEDRMSGQFSTGAVVIGAGVVGLGVARALALAGHDVTILEKNEGFGEETSARNSEVIHAGIYYPTDSLKARLCVEGRDLLYAFCESHKIGHKKSGQADRGDR